MTGESMGLTDPTRDPDRPFSILVAMTEDRVIGKNGAVPWHVSGDLKLVKKITMGGTVVMGKTTWLSIGRPLPGRIIIVVSSTLEPAEGITVCRSLGEALEAGRATGKELFCLGGASIYRQSLPLTHRMYVSMIPGTYEGDTYFPEFDRSQWRLSAAEPHEGFTLRVYDRI